MLITELALRVIIKNLLKEDNNVELGQVASNEYESPNKSPKPGEEGYGVLFSKEDKEYGIAIDSINNSKEASIIEHPRQNEINHLL